MRLILNLNCHTGVASHGGLSNQIQGVSNLIPWVEVQLLSQVRKLWIIRTSVPRVVGIIDAWHNGVFRVQTVKHVPKLIH